MSRVDNLREGGAWSTVRADGVEGWRIEIRGTVQGVGFRPWIYRLARQEGVAGWVRNDAAGVTIQALAPAPTLQRFVERIRASAPPAAVIEQVHTSTVPVTDLRDFQIVSSEPAAERRISIPPDLATCPACAAEIFDTSDRRHRYAFTNCTSCGPRFTIARAVPYDRPNTTMARFAMCDRCGREYETPADRRFHAQPNACPLCGPSLHAVSATGAVIRGDPLDAAVRALVAGDIVAVKGLGGFHLACDATSERAVLRLRERKQRDEKPFAVMVRAIEDAATLGILGAADRALLSSVERPIVLVPRRQGAPLAPSVAPRNPLVGLLLAYTPLHHLLVAEVGRPLVMTSGNRSNEPLAYENAGARRQLDAIADVFLLHDRDIVTRCDDSVARVIADGPVILRRSRGFVPRAMRLRRPVSAPVLACGALLKNTFCLADGHLAYLGPHIGDLENVDTFDAFCESIDRMESFVGIRPEILAHDRHPDYMSTQYALGRVAARKVGVQHHHAHVVSAMAEHGLSGPVIGVAYDGTGYGGPGQPAWGGEILIADEHRFERIATWRPLALPGGDAAIREPWRLAVALMADAFGLDADLGDLRVFTGRDVGVVRHMIRERVNTPLAHGVGRYFDAVGALVLERARATYEGQIALELNVALDPAEHGLYPFDVDETAALWQVDFRLTTRAIVGDVLDGVDAAAISAKFHNTVCAATTFLVRHALTVAGKLPIVLTGGCFQNARLAETIHAELAPDRVWLHRQVPPGDGGIALGQAVIAGASP